VKEFANRAQHLFCTHLSDISSLNKPELKKRKEELSNELQNQLRYLKFPAVNGDMVTQIGSVYWRFGEKEPYLKHIITLNGCCALPNIVVESYDSEAEVLLAWAKMLRRELPDVICGYNIFGSDFKFLWDRADELGIIDEFRFSVNEGYFSLRMDKIFVMLDL